MSIYIIKRRYLGENNTLNTKHDLIVTSTPLKKKTDDNSEMEWLSPLPKSPTDSLNPKVLGSASAHVDVESETKDTKQLVIMGSDEEEEFWKQRNKSMKGGRNPKTKSNRSSYQTRKSMREKKVQEQVNAVISASSEEETIARGSENYKNKLPKNKLKKPRDEDSHKNNANGSQSVVKIFEDSSEDELVLNFDRNETKRPKRTSKFSKESLRFETAEDPNQDEAKSLESSIKIFRDSLKNKLAKDSDKDKTKRVRSTLKKSNDLLRDESTEESNNNKSKHSRNISKILKGSPKVQLVKDSDQPMLDEPLPKPDEDKASENNGSDGVRRSNRKRYQPLKFWNGESLKIDRDLTAGIKSSKFYHTKKNPKTKEDTAAVIEQNDQASTNISKYSESKNRPKVTKNRKSILRSRTKFARSKTRVKFSDIQTGTTMDGPRSKNNVKPDWVINFPEIHFPRKLATESEECVALPGLNTANGTVLSALMHMPPKFINHSQAPDHHDLIFCVMVGTVSATIDETTVKIETYGHFFVPSRVSYSIENIGKENAILSFIQVSRSCANK